MKKDHKLIILLLIATLFLFIIIIHLTTSRAEPLETGIKVAENTELIYYLDIIYDGKDKELITSSDTAIANVNSDYIYIEDKIPNGLIFKGFVQTEDGTIGAIKRDNTSQSCAGYVVNGVQGLSYDANTRLVSFKVSNLQAGCKITVGIITTTPYLGIHKRLDFYNTAYGRENAFTTKSNMVHVFMGRDDETLYTVNYKYTGTIPSNAPDLPSGGSYASGISVGVAQPVSLEGYEFSGWTTSDATVNNGSFTMPNSNVTFSGSFIEKQKYTVTYNVSGEVPNGYVVPQVKSYGVGDDVKLDSLKLGDEINGYRFSGWTTSDVNISEGIFQMPAKSVKLIGSFEKISYTVTYQFQGDILPANASSLLPTTQSYYPGDRVIRASNLFVSGYRFLGWNQSEVFTMPSENIIIYGEWMVEAGLFAPEISIEIDNSKTSYKKGDIIYFNIYVTNIDSVPIYDVIIQENTENCIFDTGYGYTILNDNFAKITEIEPSSTVTLYSNYTVGDEVVKWKTNQVEMTGALAYDDYYLDTTRTYVAEVDFLISNLSLNIDKVDEDGNTLSGSQFSLYTDKSLTKLAGSGLTFSGLSPSKTYYLKETKVPIGYTILPNVLTVTVDQNGKITIPEYNVLDKGSGIYQVQIANTKINILPNTGGSGNVPYIAIGLGIVIISVLGYIYYLYKKKGDLK